MVCPDGVARCDVQAVTAFGGGDPIFETQPQAEFVAHARSRGPEDRPPCFPTGRRGDPATQQPDNQCEESLPLPGWFCHVWSTFHFENAKCLGRRAKGLRGARIGIRCLLTIRSVSPATAGTPEQSAISTVRVGTDSSWPPEKPTAPSSTSTGRAKSQDGNRRN